MKPTFGSLFSGIGGIDLGLERAGWSCAWQSEIDPYASRVLTHHWPQVPNLGDIKTIDWSGVDQVDLICGGYPCQPFSMAGRRAGTDDPRHLWPWMRDAIRVLRPRWALLENVPGHLGLGFAEVLADLAALGFDAEWELLPAAAFGAPHLRYRLFVVAHADGQSEPGRPVDAFTRPGFMVPDPCRGQLRDEPVSVFGCQRPPWAGDDGETRLMAHADDTGRGERRGTQPTPPQFGAAQYGGEDVADADSERRDWRPGVFGEGRRPESADRGPMGDADCSSENSHAETGRPWSTTGEPGWWAAEPDVGRVAHGVPARVDRLRCLGNAVVPQVAEWVGRRILEAVG